MLSESEANLIRSLLAVSHGSNASVDDALTIVRRETVRPMPVHIKRLSRREREVFAFLIRGMSPREIAAAIGVGRKTADTHRAHVLRKIGVRNIPELVLWAVCHGELPTSVLRESCGYAPVSGSVS